MEHIVFRAFCSGSSGPGIGSSVLNAIAIVLKDHNVVVVILSCKKTVILLGSGKQSTTLVSLRLLLLLL